MQEKELVQWLVQNAPLLSMCEAGGWPDFRNLNIETCSQSSSEWVIIVDFNEHLAEISVCEPVVHNRCGQFSITLDERGEPASIRLICRLS